MPEAKESVSVLRSFLEHEKSSAEGCGLWTQINTISSSLSLTDLNYILYRCDNEERDEGKGSGVYNIPGAGPLMYCGLQVHLDNEFLIRAHVVTGFVAFWCHPALFANEIKKTNYHTCI